MEKINCYILATGNMHTLKMPVYRDLLVSIDRAQNYFMWIYSDTTRLGSVRVVKYSRPQHLAGWSCIQIVISLILQSIRAGFRALSPVLMGLHTVKCPAVAYHSHSSLCSAIKCIPNAYSLLSVGWKHVNHNFQLEVRWHSVKRQYAA